MVGPSIVGAPFLFPEAMVADTEKPDHITIPKMGKYIHISYVVHRLVSKGVRRLEGTVSRLVG